eukprot:4709333-Prymnesium_polylepis.1
MDEHVSYVRKQHNKSKTLRRKFGIRLFDDDDDDDDDVPSESANGSAAAEAAALAAAAQVASLDVKVKSLQAALAAESTARQQAEALLHDERALSHARTAAD